MFKTWYIFSMVNRNPCNGCKSLLVHRRVYPNHAQVAQVLTMGHVGLCVFSGFTTWLAFQHQCIHKTWADHPADRTSFRSLPRYWPSTRVKHSPQMTSAKSHFLDDHKIVLEEKNYRKRWKKVVKSVVTRASCKWSLQRPWGYVFLIHVHNRSEFHLLISFLCDFLSGNDEKTQGQVGLTDWWLKQPTENMSICQSESSSEWPRLENKHIGNHQPDDLSSVSIFGVSPHLKIML